MTNFKIYENMSDEDYNKIDALRSTVINKIISEPTMAHAKVAIDNFERTDALIVGSLVDAMLFDDPSVKNWHILPEKFTLHSDANKALYAEKMEEFQGRVARQKHIQEAKPLYEGFFKSAFNRKVYEALKYKQLVIVWEQDFNGMIVTCKVKVDGVSQGQNRLIPWDLKTINNASQYNWQKHVQDYGYHVQTKFYLYGLLSAGLIEEDEFFHILLEKETNMTARRIIDNGALDKAEEQLNKAVEKYVKAIASDVWEGYPEIPEMTSLSHYYLNKED